MQSCSRKEAIQTAEMLMLKVCLHLFTCIVLCSCLEKNVKYQANMTCDENITLSLDVETEIPAQSAMACSRFCAGQTGCGGFLYYSGTSACHVVNASSPLLAACTLQGAAFYKIAPDCITTKPLVAELPDDQLTASSYADNFSKPLHAKMTNEYSWVAATTHYQYLQVDFMKETTVVSITTLGTVSYYRLLVSSDCVVFDLVIDKDGKYKFRSIYLSPTTNDVTPNVKARCVRIAPFSWYNGRVAMEIEIVGC